MIVESGRDANARGPQLDVGDLVDGVIGKPNIEPDKVVELDTLYEAPMSARVRRNGKSYLEPAMRPGAILALDPRELHPLHVDWDISREDIMRYKVLHGTERRFPGCIRGLEQNEDRAFLATGQV